MTIEQVRNNFHKRLATAKAKLAQCKPFQRSELERVVDVLVCIVDQLDSVIGGHRARVREEAALLMRMAVRQITDNIPEPKRSS